MAAHLGPAPLRLDRHDVVRQTREILDRANYEEDSILDRLGAFNDTAMRITAKERPRALRRTAGGDRLDTLLRLFQLGTEVEIDALRRAIEPLSPEDWADLGLIKLQGNVASARVSLSTHDGTIMVIDAPWEAGLIPPDYVLGLTRSAVTLYQATIRQPVERTLDLGTGCGFLGLRAAAHSGEVVATDLNARAVNMARFNAQLNGIETFTARTGSLFEPVAGEKFGYIVSNPPFVISPETEQIYRTSGLEGDGFCHSLARQCGDYLAEGGFAQFLCNWAITRGQSWTDRVRQWLEDLPCDAWVLRSVTLPVDQYATNWLADSGLPTVDDYYREFDIWMNYYASREIEAVGMGMITLRKRASGPYWLRMEDAPSPSGDVGESILVGFQIQDFLQQLPHEQALLEMKLAVNPEARIEQRLAPTKTGWNVVDAKVLHNRGLVYIGDVDEAAFRLLTLCRGERPLAAIIVDLANANQVDPQSLAADIVPVVREMIAQQFLLPAAS